MLVADRVRTHFYHGGALTPEASIARYRGLVELLDGAIVGESARWGDTVSRIPATRDDQWLPEVNRILNEFLPRRNGIVVEQLRAEGMYPRLDSPEFNKHGGEVAPGFQLTMSSSGSKSRGENVNSRLYYTVNGSDPRLPGGILNRASATAYVGPITLVENVHVKARVLDGNTWSALTESTFVLQRGGLAPLRENLEFILLTCLVGFAGWRVTIWLKGRGRQTQARTRLKSSRRA